MTMMASTVGVGLRCFKRRCVALGVGVTKDVDGIADAGGGGKLPAQAAGGAGMQRGDRHARELHGVGGHGPRTSGVGDDGGPVTLGDGLHRQGGGVVEQ